MSTHHTRVEDAAIHESGWVRLSDDVEVTALPVIDRAHKLPDGTPLFARLNYDEALSVARLHNASLISSEQVDLLRAVGLQLQPYLGTPTAETDIVHSERHDADVWRQLRALGWDGLKPVMGAGKHWIAGAPAGRSRLKGWDRDGAGPGKAYWQNDAVAHDRGHHDDGTTTVLVRHRSTRPDSETDLDTEQSEQSETPDMTTPIYRPTLREGDRNEHVGAWQLIVGARIDNAFGPKTEAATEEWQRRHGLVDDGVVGRKSWNAAGHKHVSEAPGTAPTKSARAAFSILRDANAAWPKRRKTSDGVWGDAAHRARPSDHNTGLACDVSHDPRSGCDGAVIADLAIQDERVTYVIFNARIYNRGRSAEGWRKYTGSNPHTSHCHISLREESRDDDRPWAWAPGQAPPEAG